MILIGFVLILFNLPGASVGGGPTTTLPCFQGGPCTSTTRTSPGNNQALVVTVSASPNPVNVGSPVTFSASTTSGQAPYSYVWYFQDMAGIGATGQTVTHTYAASGVYNVVAFATDSQGNTGQGSVQLTVTAPATQNCTNCIVIHVVSSYSNANVPGASVTLGSSTKTTDANGNAAFNVPSGSYSLTVSASGYMTLSKTGVQFAQGQTYTFAIVNSNLGSLAVVGGSSFGVPNGMLLGFGFLAVGVFMVRRRS